MNDAKAVHRRAFDLDADVSFFLGLDDYSRKIFFSEETFELNFELKFQRLNVN